MGGCVFTSGVHKGLHSNTLQTGRKESSVLGGSHDPAGVSDWSHHLVLLGQCRQFLQDGTLLPIVRCTVYRDS